MNPSPLQLNHYHFTALSVSARQEVDIDALAKADRLYPAIDDTVNFNIDIDLGEKIDTPNDYAVRVAVKCEPKEGSNFPYVFSARVEGMLTLTSDEPDPAVRKRIVVINGASMLYGAIRDQLMTLTARHIYGAMMLPSMDFRNLNPEEEGATLQEIRQPKKRARRPATKAS